MTNFKSDCITTKRKSRNQNTFVKDDNSNNFYEMNKNKYEKLMNESVTKFHKNHKYLWK